MSPAINPNCQPPTLPAKENEIMTIYTVFHLPGTDAKVALSIHGDRIAVAMLAKGTSRKSDGSYARRNPERKALFLHLLSEWCRPFDDGGARLIATRGGPTSSRVQPYTSPSPVDDVVLGEDYTRSGNYRLDIVLDLNGTFTLEDIAFGWGLKVSEGTRPPGAVRWLDTSDPEGA